MTCIIGYIGENGLYMGSDSAVSRGYEIREIASQKVFRIHIGDPNSKDELNDTLLIGFSGTMRGAQIIQFYLGDTLEARKAHQFSPEEYVVKVVIEQIKLLLKEHGALNIEYSLELQDDVHLLLGYHNDLYLVGLGFSCTRLADGYDAIGCGREYALGAIRILKNDSMQDDIRNDMTKGSTKKKKSSKPATTMSATTIVARALEASAYFSDGVMSPFNIYSIPTSLAMEEGVAGAALGPT